MKLALSEMLESGACEISNLECGDDVTRVGIHQVDTHPVPGEGDDVAAVDDVEVAALQVEHALHSTGDDALVKVKDGQLTAAEHHGTAAVKHLDVTWLRHAS